MALDLSIKSTYKMSRYEMGLGGAMDLRVSRQPNRMKPTVHFAPELAEYSPEEGGLQRTQVSPVGGAAGRADVSWCVKRKMHELSRGGGTDRPRQLAAPNLEAREEEDPIPNKRHSPEPNRCDCECSRHQSASHPHCSRHQEHCHHIPLDGLILDSTTSTQGLTTTSTSSSRYATPGEHCSQLPPDPREWSRQHVRTWLAQMQTRMRIGPVQQERFMMNGKALCLMTLRMFCDRVPEGGALLFRDFQARVNKAVAAARCRS